MLDLALAGFALVVVSPVLALTAFAIWIEDRGPAMFRQERIGHDETSLHPAQVPQHAGRQRQPSLD